MRNLGLFGMTIPEQFGGLELTMEEEVRVLFELCQTAPAFRSVIGTTVGIGLAGHPHRRHARAAGGLAAQAGHGRDHGLVRG